MNKTSQNSFPAGALENLRRRLLDLSARNRLLNFTHGGQGNVRIIDELPNELHRMLLSEEELRFQAIPDPTRKQLLEAGHLQTDPETGLESRVSKEPTATEWAHILGYATSYQLPVVGMDGGEQEKHVYQAIQTLMFPAQMESRLRHLCDRAQTAIEETGSNLCHVAFGSLEWLENQDSDQFRHAPLLLLPVRIAKGRLHQAGDRCDYSIAYTGEEIIPNLALREKLRIDFGLALPDFNDAFTPEDYFCEVERLIAGPQPRWQVRRCATVALFNFAKVLMYLDLDPKRWQSGAPLDHHPIISHLFDAGRQGEDGELGEEHAVDDLPGVHHRYPLVDDADSFQHGALVDVMEGRNLIIEGPPGSGKSQTITNLIAAALAQGRRVLFVAEKLAALKVVKRRLERAGLGDFCLELHSHKTHKRQVLDDVVTRLANQGKYLLPKQIDADIKRYEALTNELRVYAQLINRAWKETGWTIHEILMAARRCREELDIDPATLHPQNCDGQMLTADVQRRSLESIPVFAQVYRRFSKQLGRGEHLRNHPWYGVGNWDLQPFDKERVCAALSRWQDALVGLAGTVEHTASRLGADNGSALKQLDAIERLKSDLQRIPPLHGDEDLSTLPLLQGDNLSLLTRHLQLVRGIREHRKALPGPLRPELAEDPESHRQLSRAHIELERLGVAGGSDLRTLAGHCDRAERLQTILGNLNNIITQVALGFGSAYTDRIEVSTVGLREFRDLVEMVCRLRPDLLGLRHDRFEHDRLDAILPELSAQLKQLDALRKTLGQHFALDRLPAVENLKEMRTQLANSGLFSWQQGSLRDTRNALLQLSSRPEARFKELAKHVDPLYAYAKGKQALEENARYRKALGAHFAGLETRVADLQELRQWYVCVRRRYGMGFGPKVALGDAVIKMGPNIAKGLHSLGKRGIVARVDHLLRELERLKNAFNRYRPIQSREALLIGTDGPLAGLLQQLRHNLESCWRLLHDPEVSLAEIGSTVVTAHPLLPYAHRATDNPPGKRLTP